MDSSLGEDVETSLLRLESQFYAHVEQRKLQKSSEASDSSVRTTREKKCNSQGKPAGQQRKGQGAGKVVKDKKYKAPGEVRGTGRAPWRVYYDGASVMNGMRAGSGAVLQDHDGMTVDEASQYMGAQSMNVAEYVGLIEGLRLARLWNVDNLVCYGDSLVVHKQVLLGALSLSPSLLLESACRCPSKVRHANLRYVSRSQNASPSFH